MIVCSRDLGFFLVLFLFTIVCGGCSKEPIPSKIIGSWTTAVPPYTHAIMVITETSITFKNGESLSEHRITAFEKTREQARVVYTIFYESEGGTASLAFYLEQIGGREEGMESIIYKNQENLVWVKTTL